MEYPCGETEPINSHPMNTRNLKLICLVLETIGIAALFLPFVLDFSPIGALRWSWEYWPFVSPALIAPFVCLQTLRSLYPPLLTKLEQWVCAAAVGLLMLAPLAFLLWQAVSSHRGGVAVESIPIGVLLGLALFAAGLLLKLKRTGVASQFLAPLALRCAYVPNAVFCLAVFSSWGRRGEDLGMGAACVGATVVIYLAEIVYLAKQGLTARRAAAP